MIHKTKLIFGCLSCLLLITKVYAWSPQDTLNIKEIGKIAISPHENYVAYETLTPSVTETEGKWLTNVYIYQLENSETKQIVLNNYVNQSLAWSPDENSLLFLAKTAGKTCLCRYFLNTKQTDTLFEETHAITNFSMDHSGDNIAFLVPSTPTPNKYFEIIDESRTQNTLYLLHLPSKSVKALTMDISVETIHWAPDDKCIVFSHQPSSIVEDRMLHSKISKIDLSSREIVSIADNALSNFKPQFSPDGKWIAYVSGPGTWEFAFQILVFDVTTGITSALSPTPDEQVELVGWLAESQAVVVAERYHTTQRLYQLSLQGDATPFTPQNELILQPNLSAKGNLFAFRSESPDKPCEVFISKMPFKSIQISHIQPSDYPKIPTRIVSWKSPDGTPIEGLLTFPTNNSKGPYPLLVLVKGHSSLYLNTFEGGIHLAKTPYSIGVFADQGYAILRPFFRGSSGYGRKMRNSIIGDWGGKDFDDLMAGVDFLIEKRIADPDRLGIMGWSYGGFMTSKAITKTDRFKAASAGGALIDFISYAGTTDIPHFLPFYMKGWFWNNPKAWHAISPIEHIQNVKTPTLIQHSSGDKRVPPSQGFELYHALKYQGVPTKMILYSDKGHSLSNPKIIVEGIQHNVDWFNYWLKEKNTH